MRVRCGPAVSSSSRPVYSGSSTARAGTVAGRQRAGHESRARQRARGDASRMERTLHAIESARSKGHPEHAPCTSGRAARDRRARRAGRAAPRVSRPRAAASLQLMSWMRFSRCRRRRQPTRVASGCGACREGVQRLHHAGGEKRTGRRRSWREKKQRTAPRPSAESAEAQNAIYQKPQFY